MIIQYSKTFFNEPSIIKESDYIYFKSQLDKNSDCDIDPNPETFSEHFRIPLRVLGFSVGYPILYLVIFGNQTAGETKGFTLLLFVLCLFSLITIPFSLFNLLLSGRSFATYVKKRKEFFSKVKYSILHTNNYSEFTNLWYSTK